MPKPNGEKRFILNLKRLNKFIKTEHFKMEDYRTASKLITAHSYMATLDLKDAYFLIPIQISHKKYLRFRYNEILYEFNCLPFGLCTAPYVFTKLLKPVMENLRSRGFMSVVYLDDIFVIERSFQDCQYNIQSTCELLQSLGFILNYEKSCLVPNKDCKFLGFIFDSKNMILKLPSEKKEKIKHRILQILNVNSIKLRNFAKVLGLLVSACPAIRYSWLYTKVLERHKYRCLLKNPNYDQMVHIPDSLKIDLKWWLSHIENGSSPLPVGEGILIIMSVMVIGKMTKKTCISMFWNLKQLF